VTQSPKVPGRCKKDENFESLYRTEFIFMHFTGQFPRDLPRNVKKFEEETHLLESAKILRDLATSCERSVICPYDPHFCSGFYVEIFADLIETV
jgi:hypothetical protein